MITKVLSKKTSEQDDAARALGQQRAMEKRYRLRVDGQMKRSFDSKEAALTAGQGIKNTYPIVLVTVTDAESGAAETVDA